MVSDTLPNYIHRLMSVASGGGGPGDGDRPGDRKGADRHLAKTTGQAGKEATQKPKGKARQICGKEGKLFCWFCGCKRDHYAIDCPSNYCRKCGEKGHWAKECKESVCSYCGEVGHLMTKCMAGGASFTRKGRKLPEESRASTSSEDMAPKPKMPTRSISYAAAAGGKVVRRPVVDKVQSFLADIQFDFLSQDEVVARKADITRRRKEALAAYQRTLAQLQEEEDDLVRQLDADRQMSEALDSLKKLTQKVSGTAARVGKSGGCAKGNEALASGNTGKGQDAPISKTVDEGGAGDKVGGANETDEPSIRSQRSWAGEVEAAEDTEQKKQEMPVTASEGELVETPVHRDSHISESTEALPTEALSMEPSFGKAEFVGNGDSSEEESDRDGDDGETVSMDVAETGEG